MKILLTGASGFLGQHLLEVLAGNGHRLRVLLHSSSIRRLRLPSNADVIWGAIDDPACLQKAVQDIEAIVHSAWSFAAPASGAASANLAGSQYLIEKSIAAGVKRFVFISSVAVYGMQSDGETKTEDSALSGAGEARYPDEKIAVEQMLQSQASEKTTIGIFRPGPIFDDRKSYIKKQIGKCFIGLGNGRNRMPNIHALDVAQAISQWLKDGGNGVFNITPSLSLPQRDWYRCWRLAKKQSAYRVFIRPPIIKAGYLLVRQLKRLLGKSAAGNINYAIACATRDIVYSNEKLRAALGWQDHATRRYSELA